MTSLPPVWVSSKDGRRIRLTSSSESRNTVGLHKHQVQKVGFLNIYLNSLFLRLTLDPVEVELEVVDALEARLRGHKLVIAVLRIGKGQHNSC